MAEVTLNVINNKIDNLTTLVEKQNGRLMKVEHDIAKHYTQLAVAKNDIEEMERRPSAVKAVIYVGSVIGVITIAATLIVRYAG